MTASSLRLSPFPKSAPAGRRLSIQAAELFKIMVNFWRKVNHHEVVYSRNYNQIGAIGELSGLPKIPAA
jgi:hypothetical protein